MEPGFLGTSMAILAGDNASTAKTNYGKATVKAVNTGWAPAEADLASDILSLWGMADLGSDQTDVFTLSMTYDPNRVRTLQPGNGGFGIGTRDGNGRWVNAVDMNDGGVKTFVLGPWSPDYTLGAYGFDPDTSTAWAVINHNSDFAVQDLVPGEEGVLSHGVIYDKDAPGRDTFYMDLTGCTDLGNALEDLATKTVSIEVGPKVLDIPGAQFSHVPSGYYQYYKPPKGPEKISKNFSSFRIRREYTFMTQIRM